MKALLCALAIGAATVTAAHAESVNKSDDPKQQSPGTTGAMNNPGVATDPGGVKAQQGDTSKASPGTVGAAPGADSKSQTGK